VGAARVTGGACHGINLVWRLGGSGPGDRWATVASLVDILLSRLVCRCMHRLAHHVSMNATAVHPLAFELACLLFSISSQSLIFSICLRCTDSAFSSPSPHSVSMFVEDLSVFLHFTRTYPCMDPCTRRDSREASDMDICRAAIAIASEGTHACADHPSRGELILG
jgi:hypothetical protein